jgi:UDP-N-acetylmuramate dehydrogenase
VTTAVAVADAERILRAEGLASVRSGVPLAPFTSFRIGGPAALFLEADGSEDLRAAATAVGQTGLPWFVLGKGSNVLVADEGFAGLVIHLGKGFRWIERSGSTLRAGAATPLPTLANAALAGRLMGLEFGVSIPGSVGGAVRMNAGAHGRSMSDVLEEIELFSIHDGRSDRIAATAAGFAYRHSELPAGSLVVSASLSLTPGEEPEIRQLMDEARRWRRATQPLAEANCGSVFTNPPGDHAARLVEASGCKGLSVGGASVSDKHANFIVAQPGTTAADVRRLIELVRERVRSAFGVTLETEVRVVGAVDPSAA